jgi:hypothetical protein
VRRTHSSRRGLPGGTSAPFRRRCRSCAGGDEPEVGEALDCAPDCLGAEQGRSGDGLAGQAQFPVDRLRGHGFALRRRAGRAWVPQTADEPLSLGSRFIRSTASPARPRRVSHFIQSRRPPALGCICTGAAAADHQGRAEQLIGAPMMNSSTLARSTTTARFPYAPSPPTRGSLD